MENKVAYRPGERIFLWVLIVISILVLVYSLQIPHKDLSGPGVFPIFIGAILLVSALRVLWANRNIYRSLPLGQELRQAADFTFPRTVTVFAVILILYILLLQPLHFIASSYLFLVGSFIFLKGTTVVRAFLTGVGFLALIYFIFQYIFKVVLW